MESKQYINEANSTNLTDEQYAKVCDRLQDLKTVKLLHALMGICTESGELMDAIKKHLMYGKPIDFTNLKEEAGDIEWYIALLLGLLGTDHTEIFTINIEKLRLRYPNKFTEFDALNRDLPAERKILEGSK